MAKASLSILFCVFLLCHVSGCEAPANPVQESPPGQPAVLGEAGTAPKDVLQQQVVASDGVHKTTDMQAHASDGLDDFLTSNFQTWSDGDMPSYRSNFHPRARIFFVDEGKIQHDLNTKDFFAQQEKFIKEAKGSVEEFRVRSVVQEGALGASAVVYWKLREGDRESTGVDRFTIIRTDIGSLKILSLTYYPKKF